MRSSEEPVYLFVTVRNSEPLSIELCVQTGQGLKNETLLCLCLGAVR